MKKIIIALGLIAMMLVIPKVYAATWSFEWDNTVVEIPVGKALADYKNKPVAHLYKNGSLCSDAVITYSREGDWLYFLKDVNTSVVGEYLVWYKAYENEKYVPGTCTGYKSLIKFVVKDVTPPKISVLNNKVSIRRGTEYNLKDNVAVTDDYNKNLEVTAISDFDPNVVGVYDVTIKAFDGYNMSSATYSIEVTDFSYPEITYLGSPNGINVSLNGTLDLSEYFKASDRIDGDLTKDINYPVVDTNKISNETYTVTVKNKAGNETSYDVVINVIDDVAPVLTMLKSSLILDYKCDLSTIDFSKYVTITDNVSINYNNLEITNNIDPDVVGQYYVDYKYTDGSFEVTGKLEVRIMSNVPPTLKVSDCEVKVGEIPNLYSYVTFYDESDKNVVIQFENEPTDYSTPGTYYVTVRVYNSSGKSSSGMLKLTILREETDNINEDTTPNNVYFIVGAVGLVLVVVGLVGYKLYKKKKNDAV